MIFNIGNTGDLNSFQSNSFMKDYTENEGSYETDNHRLLIVDDDDILREFIDQALSTVNIKVKSVNNALDALDLFANEKFELVLTDIQMPGMDGWELATNIKKISPDTPVILMTGMQSNYVEEKMKKINIDSILYKPFSFKLLETTVNNCLVKGEKRIL
jgi:DNA-binding NtrC family response regulator